MSGAGVHRLVGINGRVYAIVLGGDGTPVVVSDNMGDIPPEDRSIIFKALHEKCVELYADVAILRRQVARLVVDRDAVETVAGMSGVGQQQQQQPPLEPARKRKHAGRVGVGDGEPPLQRPRSQALRLIPSLPVILRALFGPIINWFEGEAKKFPRMQVQLSSTWETKFVAGVPNFHKFCLDALVGVPSLWRFFQRFYEHPNMPRKEVVSSVKKPKKTIQASDFGRDEGYARTVLEYFHTKTRNSMKGGRGGAQIHTLHLELTGKNTETPPQEMDEVADIVMGIFEFTDADGNPDHETARVFARVLIHAFHSATPTAKLGASHQSPSLPVLEDVSPCDDGRAFPVKQEEWGASPSLEGDQQQQQQQQQQEPEPEPVDLAVLEGTSVEDLRGAFLGE
jgi:hypothetical protein